MKLFKTLSLLGMAGALVLGVSPNAISSESKPAGLSLKPASNAALTAPMRNTRGRVKALSASVLILEVGGRAQTFVVDENTGVLARGAGKATRMARKAGAGLAITDLVHPGDLARVGYRELDGAMRAVEVQITGRSTIPTR